MIVGRADAKLESLQREVVEEEQEDVPRVEENEDREVRFGFRYNVQVSWWRQLLRHVRRVVHQARMDSRDFTATTEETLTMADRSIQLALSVSDSLLERCTTTHTELLVLTQRRYRPRLLTWLNPLSFTPLYAVAVLAGAGVGLVVAEVTHRLLPFMELELRVHAGTAGAALGGISERSGMPGTGSPSLRRSTRPRGTGKRGPSMTFSGR